MASRSTTRSPAPNRPPPQAPTKQPKHTGLHLEERRYDLIGLALVALSVFFAFVIWLGWDGGRVGGGAVDGLKWLVGEDHHVAPVVFMLVGSLVFMRSSLPAGGASPRGAARLVCLLVRSLVCVPSSRPAVGPIRTGLALLFFASVIWLARGNEAPEEAG